VPPRSIAQGFADHLNSLLNRTITDARLTLVEDPVHEARFTLACLRGTAPVSFALHGTGVRLLVVQSLRVVEDHCETLSYQYRLSAGEEKDSWLIRWEYLRQKPVPEYQYPLAHVHVNGDLRSDALDAQLTKLHIPTRRVPIELVIWHAIVEWGAAPKRDDWRDLLEESLEEFERRRRAP
jgi:hypothetical protein